MSTVATQPMKDLAVGWEKIFPSAVCSGLIGDKAHQKRGGYHIGRKFQPGSNYSVVRPDDRPGRGPSNASGGVDMSMSKRDMIECTHRLLVVFNDRNDPRRKYLNAFNGWLGGSSALRFDIVARKQKVASADHKWHIHAEVRRGYVLSKVMVTAVLSVLRGESKSTYLARLGVVVNPTPEKTTVVKPGAAAKTPTPPKYAGKVLTRGDKDSPAVKSFQARMIQRGWRSIGKADGDFGPKTEACVKRFQKYCKVAADGKIGPKTWPLPWTKPL